MGLYCIIVVSLLFIMLITEEEFDSLVDEAWENIPVRFRDEVENVLIAIEDFPNPRQLRKMKIRGTLLGLYDGVPKTAWGQAVMGIQPSKITIFRGPIIHQCRTEDELKELISDVLMHEVGHYFGYDEDGIRELENRARAVRKENKSME